MAEPLTPFVEIPENPAPAGLQGGTATTRDRKRLRYAISRPAGVTRGTVVILQGRNETIEKYFETIADLNRLSYAVAIFDWRGQGGSDRLLRRSWKGYVGSVDAYVRDLDCILEDVVLRDCRGPYAILAHSMGGLVALAAMPLLANRIERVVLAAPLVAFTNQSWPARALQPVARIARLLGLGRVALRRVRRTGFAATLEGNPLTSDARRYARNRALADAAPHLFVPGLTAGWLNACAAAMTRLRSSDVIAEMQIPTLFVTAGADRVVRTAAAEHLAWRMRSGHLISLPGARHELLQETDRHRELLLAAFDAFVGPTMPQSKAAPEIVLDEAELA